MCQRCNHINYVEINGTLKAPFECQNDTCRRKGQFKPMFPQHLVKTIWKLPGKPLESTPHEIYNDILCYLKSHLILKPDEYHLMTLWIMASYLVSEFDTVPYLLFIAPKESGKSQALSVINHIGYRGFLAASVTPASLFRAIELWKITLLVDEAEFQINKDTENGQALY